MVKVNRTYSLSIENIESLKTVGNASELIDTLLNQHFTDEETVDLEKLEQKKKDLFDNIELTTMKISHLDSQINLIKEKDQIEQEKKDLSTALKSWKEEYEILNKQYSDEEISADVYWRKVDELEARRPTVRKENATSKEE